MITPTSDDERLSAILSSASGFVYYVSVTGITGTASAAGHSVTTAYQRIRKKTDLPIIAAGGIGDGRGLAAMLAIGILHLSSTYYNHHLHASFSTFVLFGCHIMRGVLILTYVVIFAHSSMCLYF